MPRLTSQASIDGLHVAMLVDQLRAVPLERCCDVLNDMLAFMVACIFQAQLLQIALGQYDNFVFLEP